MIDLNEEGYVPVKHYGITINDYFINREGDVYSKKRNKILSTSPAGKYLKVTLYVHNIREDITVHRLVAEAFVPNDDPINKTDVNHKDCNTHNNHADNLEWVTKEQNSRYASTHGGTHNVYNDILIHFACYLMEAGIPNKLIGDFLTDLKGKAIDSIRLRRLRVGISENYFIPKNIKCYNENKVRKICHLLEGGDMSLIQIGKIVNLPVQTPYGILHKRMFDYISKEYNINFVAPPERKLPDHIAHAICRYKEVGFTNEEIMERIVLSVDDIYNVLYSGKYDDIVLRYGLTEDHPKRRINFSIKYHKLDKGIINNDSAKYIAKALKISKRDFPLFKRMVELRRKIMKMIGMIE